MLRIVSFPLYLFLLFDLLNTNPYVDIMTEHDE